MSQRQAGRRAQILWYFLFCWPVNFAHTLFSSFFSYFQATLVVNFMSAPTRCCAVLWVSKFFCAWSLFDHNLCTTTELKRIFVTLFPFPEMNRRKKKNETESEQFHDTATVTTLSHPSKRSWDTETLLTSTLTLTQNAKSILLFALFVGWRLYRINLPRK